MNILSVDVGTTSMRGILYDRQGYPLHIEDCQTPLVMRGGLIEQEAEVYRKGLTAICRAAAEHGAVDAVSLTAFRSAPTLVDREGNALCNFIMWQDTRNREICSRLSHANGEVYRTCGAKINTVFTASKITWLRENAPELYRRAYKAMVVPDYLAHLMTGQFVTDRTYGSRASLMSIHTLEWDDEMCRLFSIDKDKLCRLIDQGTAAGTVHAAFSHLTGLREGIPVISAGGDQQCGALGLGALDGTSLVINSGTGSFILSLSDAPRLDNPSTICNVSAIRGKYTLEANVLASAAAVNWTIKELLHDLWHGGQPDLKAFDALAESAQPLAGGLYCVPHLQGCGTRDWNPGSRATFTGFSLTHTRADVARALLEGIAAEVTKSVHALGEDCRQAEEVFVGGGLSRSAIYNQILSDMLGKRLLRHLDSQATAIGAFVSAAVALGLYPDHYAALAAVRAGAAPEVYEPREEVHQAYQGYIQRTEYIYKVLCQ